MNFRADALETPKQLQVVLERQVGVQSIDDVYFRQRLVAALTKLLPGILERHRVRVRVARAEPRERTEQAARHADVGRLDANVVVVVCEIAVPPLALANGE